MQKDSLDEKKHGVLAIVASTLAAFVGVQNDANRARDFQQKSIIPYLLVGIVLTTIFIVALVMVAIQLDPTV